MSNKETVRLNKLVKEFNVSIDRIFSFLESKGIKDLKPNSKVSYDIYMDLLGEFDSEKKAKLSATKKLGAGETAAIIAKTVVHDIATTAELGAGKRRVAHVLGMWGTILFWVASVVMIFKY